jgi:hypothetical protein
MVMKKLECIFADSVASAPTAGWFLSDSIEGAIFADLSPYDDIVIVHGLFGEPTQRRFDG